MTFWTGAAGKQLARNVRDVRAVADVKTGDARRAVDSALSRHRASLPPAMAGDPLEARLPADALPAGAGAAAKRVAPGLRDLPAAAVAADLEARRLEAERIAREAAEAAEAAAAAAPTLR